MTKASRVAVRTARKMASMEERIQRIELMLEAIMTKKQREQFDALLAEMEAENEVITPSSRTQREADKIHATMSTPGGDVEVTLEDDDAQSEATA